MRPQASNLFKMRINRLLRLLSLSALILFASRDTFAQLDFRSDPSEDTFQWKKAIAEGFFAVAQANAFRAATQPETRDAIYGPFWKQYARSVQNFHGFNDGDGFFTSYVLHTMEGSFAGYIERQNDPKYRDVEFGTSQRYWISTMRSLAFSTAYSIVWNASPFGESGVGNVQLHNKPGIVDLIASQTLGLGWMVGEDALDRYVIKRIERRVRNPYIRLLARSTLNPTRGYANTLALRRPQTRDSRPGVFVYRPSVDDKPAEELAYPKFRASSWPENTAFEFEAHPVVQRYLGAKGSTCIGGGGEGTVRFSPVDLAFMIDGCELSGLQQNVSGDALNYVVGPRWSFNVDNRWFPFAELLVGGTKITHATTDPDKKRKLEQEAKEKNQPPPEYAKYNTEVDTNGFTVLASAGVSYRFNDAFSWRVGSFGYQRSWMLDRLQGFDYNQGFRFTMGFAFTMGSWGH